MEACTWWNDEHKALAGRYRLYARASDDPGDVRCYLTGFIVDEG